MTRRASTKGLLALAAALALVATAGGQAAAQRAGGTPIISGPLAKLDIKPAQIDTAKSTPKGTLTVAMHFALDPHDLALSKLPRNSPIDREDARCEPASRAIDASFARSSSVTPSDTIGHRRCGSGRFPSVKPYTPHW